MTTATIHAAKTNLSRLVAEAEAGGEVVIMRGAVPVVRLVAIGANASRPRVFGAPVGQVRAGTTFDESLRESELLRWEG